MSKPGLYTLQVHTSCQVNQSNWHYTYKRRLPENVAEATLEVGATTVPSHFLAFMAFLAAFMAFIAFVAVFGAASELRLSLLSSPSWLWLSWPPSSPWLKA